MGEVSLVQGVQLGNIRCTPQSTIMPTCHPDIAAMRLIRPSLILGQLYPPQTQRDYIRVHDTFPLP